MEHLDNIGEMHQTSRRQHLLALNAVRLALAVPALKGLGDAVPNRVGQPEVLAERGRGTPVVRIHLIKVVPPVGEKPDAGFDALSKWPTITDVSQQEGETASGVADVEVSGIVLERLVVAEPLRLFVRIYVASQPGQHGGVIHDLAFLLVHREIFGKAQRDIGLPEHMLGGVAQSKVGAERQRAEELGHLHSCSGSFHAPIVMPRGSFVMRRSGGGTTKSARQDHVDLEDGRAASLPSGKVYFYPSRRN